jgi:hypothetical protein
VVQEVNKSTTLFIFSGATSAQIKAQFQGEVVPKLQEVL